MPGIHFGDEEEARQTEALAGRMIEDIGLQHAVISQRVVSIKYTAPSWEANNIVVDELTVELSNGAVIRARQAVLDTERAPAGFREALRAENERQARTADRGGSIRETGEALADHPGPELDDQGDPV